jgi:hypothetical protein
LRNSYQVLKPGGYLCFDVWDADFARLGFAYRRLGFVKYDHFQRYQQSKVIELVNDIGFVMVEQQPRFGHKLVKRIIRKTLWGLFRQTNARIFLVRKPV